MLEQLVDIVIFGTADRQRIEAGLIEKGLWIRAAAMRRVEYEGNALTCRFQNLKQLASRVISPIGTLFTMCDVLCCCHHVASWSALCP